MNTATTRFLRMAGSIVGSLLVTPDALFAETKAVQLVGSCYGQLTLADEAFSCGEAGFCFSMTTSGGNGYAYFTVPVNTRTGGTQTVTFVATDSKDGYFKDGTADLYQVLDTAHEIQRVAIVCGECSAKIDPSGGPWARIVCRGTDGDGRHYAVDVISRPR